MALADTTPWRTEDHLRDDADIVAYLDAVLEENDPKLLAHALGVVARAKGISDIARETGLGRQNLYKALSETGNPTLETLLAVIRALGLKLHVAAE